MTSQFKPIAILGAGSWGTALALYLARRGQEVRIWSVDATEIEAMRRDKAHQKYLPDISFPDTIHPMFDLAETIQDIEDILIVVPSYGFRQTLQRLTPHLQTNARIICATKGIDAKTGLLLNAVAQEVLGNHYPYAVLSGPSFAREVAKGLPAAVVIASTQETFLHDLIKRFDSELFNIYPSQDVVGVELGGIVKNVLAIAVGIADGMALGANTQSALLTLGFAELARLGNALGGQQETFLGLSGLGDLILTCSDNQSRNRRLGFMLGQGLSIIEAEKKIGQVLEGKNNAELVVNLAREHHLSMPICEATWQILQDKGDAKKLLISLLKCL